MSNTNLRLDRTTPRKNYTIGDNEYETFEEYIEAIDEDTFYEWDRCPQYLIQEHEEITDHYVDYNEDMKKHFMFFRKTMRKQADQNQPKETENIMVLKSPISHFMVKTSGKVFSHMY